MKNFWSEMYQNESDDPVTSIDIKAFDKQLCEFVSPTTKTLIRT